MRRWLALFLVLYFGGCKVLGEIVIASQKAARVERANVLKKYHALVTVGAGAVAFVGCSLPTLLIRMNERSEQRRYTEEYGINGVRNRF